MHMKFHACEISKLKRYNIGITTSISTITAAQSMQLRIFKSACQWNIERFLHLVSIPTSGKLFVSIEIE